MSQLRQERDMLAVKSEFWRMSKRISGSDLVCTDSMPFDHSNHSNHTLPCQKQIARWTASHFFHDWIHFKRGLWILWVFESVHLCHTPQISQICANSLKEFSKRQRAHLCDILGLSRNTLLTSIMNAAAFCCRSLRVFLYLCKDQKPQILSFCQLSLVTKL